MASHWMRGVIRAAAICAVAALSSVGLASPGPARVEDDKKAAASQAREARQGLRRKPLQGGSHGASPVEPGRLLAGRRILIVEGEPTAAGVIERALAAHGGTVLGPTASLAGALAWVLATTPDAAVLGVTGISGRWTAPPIAAALQTRGVPYVVVTAGRAAPPRALRDAPRLSRPFRAEELVLAVAAAVAQAG